MTKKGSIDIRGFKGRAIPNTFFRQRVQSDALCVLFGGWHYTTDMPLFFYTREIFTGLGYDVLAVDFRYFSEPRYARLSDEKRREVFLEEVGTAFKAKAIDGYRRLVIVAKSLGTMALEHLLLEGLPNKHVRLIWLSPLLEADSIRTSLGSCRFPSLIVLGERDPQFDAGVVERLGENKNLDIMVVAGADDNLESDGEVGRSIGLISSYIDRLRIFLGMANAMPSRAPVSGVYTTLIDSRTLGRHLGDKDWVVVDCRFDLDDTNAGSRAYEKAHIPGAVYAHLERDLSGTNRPQKGRHPLPSVQAMTKAFERLGISNRSQVVVYDDSQGMYAARLWWMLRYMGHEAVAVLDGGFTEWRRMEGPTEKGVETNPEGRFEGSPQKGWYVVKSHVKAAKHVVDSRAPERFRGVGERRDPRAGHIPDAVSYHWRANIDANGCFLPAGVIRSQMKKALQKADVDKTIFYCGSGVSACVDILAGEVAGLGTGRLYVGSWSEWSRDPKAPVATGKRQRRKPAR